MLRVMCLLLPHLPDLPHLPYLPYLPYLPLIVAVDATVAFGRQDREGPVRMDRGCLRSLMAYG